MADTDRTDRLSEENVLTTLYGDKQCTEMEASRRIGSVQSMVLTLESIGNFVLVGIDVPLFLLIWHMCSKDASRF